MKSLLFKLSVLWGATAWASASPTINWWTVDSGGGTSSGGGYTLSGTIGQTDADSAPAVSYEFLVQSGFWAAGDLPLTLPVLSIAKRPDGKVDLSWGEDAIGWHLEVSYDLNDWAPEGPATIFAPGTITNQPGPLVIKKFYRLRQ